ncbi:HipA family kinase [Ramlibacter alkalitolerans]|uniref:HipA family kinase n=1 Tax=Ramlibacter alkalitolerans TaxID=2039631 RepID=UPI002ECFFAC2
MPSSEPGPLPGPPLRTVAAARYVTPLREGGSMPAVVEGDDDGLYVLKFRGAGQGPKALIAELVAGELARVLGLLVPEIVFMELDADLARTEADPEIQDLIRASVGLNLALDFLPSALAYDPLVHQPDAQLASRIVWFDACVMNVDRTARNTNMLLWHRRLWLIDHGASLYFQHQWDDYMARSRSPFAPIKDHVLLPQAAALEAADAECRPLLSEQVIARAVDRIPDAWLTDTETFAEPARQREAYRNFLVARVQASPIFTQEAVRARSLRV